MLGEQAAGDRDVLADRGQRWIAVRCERDVVVADDSDVVGDGAALRTDLFYRRDGHQVAVHEHAVDVWGRGEERAHRGGTRLGSEVAIRDELGLDRSAGGLERSDVARVPIL